ncbi:MAG: PHP domain-containing protein [Chloroflexota bacterium]|nr:PHP domain-containing protein [Chloroflexota bacterium]
MNQSRFREPASEMVSPRRNKIDLHCHTDRSDGVLQPAVLFDQMRAFGLRLAAISDHDTLSAYRELRREGRGAAASPDGPRLVPAVEINSVADDELVRMGVQLEEGELHVLGYGVDPDDEEFERRLAAQRGARRTRFLLMIEALRRLGKPIDDEIAPYLATEEALGRPHIARAMIEAGHVATLEEAFDVWIDRNGPAYVARQGMRTREAIESIADAGGLPVLAHYHAAPDQPELINLLIGWGLRGLEVHYRRFLPETVERVAAFCATLDLVATGGSDYHGDGMSYAEAQATTFVPDLVGERLLAALEGRRAGAGR